MFRPNVLADRNPDAPTTESQRRNLRGRLEVPIFIEYVVSGQKRFVRSLRRLIGLKQSRGVMEWLTAAFVPINKTDQQCRFAQPFLKAIEHRQIFRNEPGFKEEVLRWITGNRQLRRDHDIGADLCELIVSGRDFLEVALQITDGWIDLRETDFHPRNKLRARNGPARNRPTSFPNP